MILVWVEFLICASIVVIAGTKLARYGDFIAGLIHPPQRKPRLRASWYAIALMGVFIIGAYLNFTM